MIGAREEDFASTLDMIPFVGQLRIADNVGDLIDAIVMTREPVIYFRCTAPDSLASRRMPIDRASVAEASDIAERADMAAKLERDGKCHLFQRRRDGTAATMNGTDRAVTWVEYLAVPRAVAP